ncbi:protein aq_1444 [Geobacter sp. OR-1]|uniref:AmmeMemoRadiSam system protein A n=1 Tax=Geobacter sp. OR-1 TaxID=1266765 RepID=UPI000543D5FD|nr:AmmeMemoRadiSam system protein A [Geobacter sp. OR-1]GAM07953.1 protein aq_1444 [Geobacter sp. OR-1]
MAKMFGKDDRRQLLHIAREAITSFVSTGSVSTREAKSEKLQQCFGCFVTIKVDEKLRGCIGNFISDKPLCKLVPEMATAAATKDPRFYPMKKQDLDNFALEISVLSPLQKIAAIDEIHVGTHGIYMERNFHRGVLLPQVATEYGWDRDTFLQQTALKAGMGKDDWKENTDIYVFSAEVFNEDELIIGKRQQ